MFCVSLAATVLAQGVDEEIEGVGTTNFIARFLNAHKIGNSSIFQSPNGNIGIGTTPPDSTLSVFSLSNSLTADGLQPYAIAGVLNNSTINFSAAIRGDALASSGGVAGVNGVSVDPEGGGYGVLGASVATSGSGGGGGVLGTTQMTTAFSTGVRGEASGTSGGAVAVFGDAFSPDGSPGLHKVHSRRLAGNRPHC